MKGVGWLLLVAGCSSSGFDLAPVAADGGDDASGDITAVDTSAMDAIVAGDSRLDTTVADANVDAAPKCPAPRSEKTHEITTTDCTVLQNDHAKAVAAAKECNCDDDCRDKLGRDLCGCQTFANPAREEYLLAIAIADHYGTRGCSLSCPKIPCIDPVAAKCVVMGARKVCQDAL